MKYPSAKPGFKMMTKHGYSIGTITEREKSEFIISVQLFEYKF